MKSIQEKGPMVRQADARGLREALAYCANNGVASVRGRAMRALTDYAKRVNSYCQHPDMAQMPQGKICLDCGHRVASIGVVL